MSAEVALQRGGTNVSHVETQGLIVKRGSRRTLPVRVRQL